MVSPPICKAKYGRRCIMSRPADNPAPPTAKILPLVRPPRKLDPRVMRDLRLLVDISLALIEGGIPLRLAIELVRGFAPRHAIDARLVDIAFETALEISESTGGVWRGQGVKGAGLYEQG
jgi:hypothetical protein